MVESEHNIQASFVEWVLWTYKNDPTFIRPLFFSNLTGAFLGGTGFKNFAKLEEAGALPGVSDLLYLQPRGAWSYMALELKIPGMKRRRNRGLSEEQVSFLDSVSEAGGLPSVCYGIDEAIEAFTAYMNMPARGIFARSDMIYSAASPLKSEESRS